MRVRELIEILKNMDQDAIVTISNTQYYPEGEYLIDGAHKWDIDNTVEIYSSYSKKGAVNSGRNT